MSDKHQTANFRPKLIAVSVAACFAVTSSQVYANPTGPTVISGSATFATAGNALNVTNSANAIIQWQGFSIGVNEITRFLQPSAASAVLNRVTGSGGVVPQSLIDGILSSNGHVYLLNPMGVLISSTARIDVAGLVASSLNLSDQDFLNGRLRFTEVPGAGGVSNSGVIETPSGGRVFLIAPSVENAGIIRSPQGEIVLAAGKEVDLVAESSPFVSVRLSATNEQAVNVGNLISESGRIGVYGALVRNSGVAEASGAVVGAGGQIRFVATKDVSIEAGSRVSANGTSGGSVLVQAEGGTNLVAGRVEATGSAGRGGSIQALGVRVGVVGNGVIDASGETGGGSVMVGGDYLGGNSGVQNAQSTEIGANGVIRADARTTGDGGRVIVWADGDANFAGRISARGGSASGDGGFVETSGKQSVTISGTVNAGATHGKGGTWLVDPVTDLLIDAMAAAAFNTSMAYGTTVTPVAGQDINFAANINGTGLPSIPGGGFVAQAGRDINLASNTITTNRGDVRLTANTAGYGGSINSTMPFGTTQIATNGGGINLTGVGVRVGGLDTTSAMNSPGGVLINATTGNIETGSVTTRGIAPGTDGGSVNMSTTSGSIHVNGTIDTRGADNASGFYGGAGGSVSLSRSSGNGMTILVTGSILTGGGAGRSGSYYGGTGGGRGGNVNLSDHGASGSVTVLGGIDTRGGPGLAGDGTDGLFRGSYGGEGGQVNIFSTGTVNLAGVTTVGGPGGAGGSRSINTAYGGTVDVRGGGGGEGGDVWVNALGALTISGQIDTSNGAGGAGGSGAITATPGGGSVNATVDARGGDGGGGFHSGSVSLTGSTVSTQGIVMRGADGGPGGSATITVVGPAGSVSANAYASGGAGGDVSGFYGAATGLLNIAGQTVGDAGRGGNGGTASISVPNSVSVNAYADASGGQAGHVDSIELEGATVAARDISGRGGDGGHGGSATTIVSASGSANAYAFARGGSGNSGGEVFVSASGSIGSAGAPLGNIDTRGGAGGNGSPASAVVVANGGTVGGTAAADGGEGGSSDLVELTSGSGTSIHAGNITTLGGKGGNAGSASFTNNGAFDQSRTYAYGGHGGEGGQIYAFAYGGPIVLGNLIAKGGDGGIGASGGGHGGEGGSVMLKTDFGVTVGAAAVTDVFGTLVIDTSGGAAAPGGLGGDAGYIDIDPTFILLNGAIAANGGAPGGHGGDITLYTGSEAAPGLITFVNAIRPDQLGALKGFTNFGAGPDGIAGDVFTRGNILYVFLTSSLIQPEADLIRSCKP